MKFLMQFVILVVSGFVFAQQSGQESRSEVNMYGPAAEAPWFMVNGKGYRLSEPVALNTGPIESMDWSDDGTFILFTTKVSLPFGDNLTDGYSELVSYNLQSHKSVVLIKQPTSRTHLLNVLFIPGTDRYVIERMFLPDPHQSPPGEAAEGISTGLATGGEPTPVIPSFAEYQYEILKDQPSNRVGIASVGGESTPRTITWLESNGSLGTKTKPVKCSSWIRDSSTGGIDAVDFNLDKATGRGKAQFFSLKDNNWVPTARPIFDPAKGSGDLYLKVVPSSIKLRKISVATNSIWIGGQGDSIQPDALITSDGINAFFSKDHKYVAYSNNEGAFIVKLNSLSAEEIANMIRAQKLAEVKQVGLALIMYSNDHNDKLPVQGELSGVNDYLKNEAFLKEFHYTYSGPSTVTAINSPADTPLGYIDAPGGRAVVFSDGHARFVPNP